MENKTPSMTTKAAFQMPGKSGWTWIKWNNKDASKHAAIVNKAKEIGAFNWDFGQADHFFSDEFPVSR